MCTRVAILKRRLRRGLDVWAKKAAKRKARRDWERGWVYARRQRLISWLGGRCSYLLCGATENLCFDHWLGSTWKVRAKNQRSRIVQIEREARRGLIRLLCKRCNGRHNPKDGRPLPLVACVPPPALPSVEDEVPF
jgi:hypothetical protein